MANWQKRKLYFDQISKAGVLTPERFLGDGVRLAFDPKSKMDVSIEKSRYKDHSGAPHEALICRGVERASSDWMSLEIDFNPIATGLRIKMRYAPAERVYPRIYYTENGKSREVDLPDFTLAFDYMWHHIGSDVLNSYLGASRSAISQARLALLFPNRPWFALGLSCVEEML